MIFGSHFQTNGSFNACDGLPCVDAFIEVAILIWWDVIDVLRVN